MQSAVGGGVSQFEPARAFGPSALYRVTVSDMIQNLRLPAEPRPESGPSADNAMHC